METPAACESILAVAALDSTRQIAPFSCCEMDAARVDLSAPGVEVYSAWIGGGYQTESGTSMAAPHVAGVAALWLEYGKPPPTASELWTKLTRSAEKLGGSTADVGAGLVRAPVLVKG